MTNFPRRRPLYIYRSFQRDQLPVLREPGFETQQLRIQGPRGLEAARSRELTVELDVVLEHVAEIIRARESEAAVRVEVHGEVADLLAQRLRHVERHLAARDVLVRDADALADPLPA